MIQPGRSGRSHSRMRNVALFIGLVSLFFALGAIFIAPAESFYVPAARKFIDTCFILAPFAAGIAYWILHVRRNWARHVALALMFIPLTAGLVGLFFYAIM